MLVAQGENMKNPFQCFSMRKLCISVGIILMLIAMTAFSVPATAQLVTVQFLNGKSGKPIKKGSRVWAYFFNRNGRQILDMHTDSQGVIQFDAGEARSFQVSAVGFVPCGEQPVGAPTRDYLIEEILKHGLLTKNECGVLNSEPLRGRLIYFVRPATWWELFKH